MKNSSQPSAVPVHILNLLALIERPDVLPEEATLRIAGELLAWTEQDNTRFRCDPVTYPEP
jgi:ribulose 1,5-bisphosphate synthetase/thiazole synthase